MEDTTTTNTKRNFDQIYLEKNENYVKPVENKTKKQKNKEADDTVTSKYLVMLGYLKVYTDGACSKNGSKNACAGIGVYFEDKTYGYKNISKKIEGKQTNNTGELSAILEVLKVVDTKQDILIHTDSNYAINGIIGINKINANKELFEDIKKMIKTRFGRTDFKKVKGHSGKCDGNYFADKLATSALKY